MNNSDHGDRYRWLVLGIVMLGTFMAILVSSSVNVALPYIMSAFQVNQNQIEWVTTGYMIGSAVAMPLVGWLAGRLGYKTLYLTSLAVFTIGSLVCSSAWSYSALVVSRIIQAAGGGAIMPLGMAMVVDLFEPHERGKALGIWGSGVMVAPAFGPTLGGYLTDFFSWRALFWVNIPFGILAFLAALFIMKSDLVESRKRIPFDFLGYLFLSMGVIAGLLALSKGQMKGWDSEYIRVCLWCTVIGSVMFIAIESVVEHPLIDLRLFLIRNYWVSMLLAVFRAVGLFGGVFLLPLFLENLSGYSTIHTGLLMMPGAVVLAVIMPIAGRMADRYKPSWLTSGGIILTGISMLIYGYLDPNSGQTMIIAPQIMRSIGLGFMMAPILPAAMYFVPKAQTATAASFLNVSQQIGGAFGIALLNARVTDAIHLHIVRMGELMGNQTVAFSRFAANAAQYALHHPFAQNIPGPGVSIMSASINHLFIRAEVAGFQNGFVIAGLIVLSCLPFSFLLKPGAHHEIPRNSSDPIPAK
jgi:EmrB/QacA subfamily drug resistance transporter